MVRKKKNKILTKTMTNKETISKLATIYPGISTNKLSQIIASLIHIITEAVKKNESIKISGLGIFIIKQIKERPGINPRTKEKMIIPSHKAIKFRASETLKKAMKR